MQKFFYILFAVFSVLWVAECCQPLWHNQCTSNSDCCSGFCFLGDIALWEKGVCKPANLQSDGMKPSGCHPIWYNQCTSNSDCCSGFCFMGDDDNRWAEGVCKPTSGVIPSAPHPPNSQPSTVKPPGVNCHPDQYDHCEDDSDCCSRFCYLGPDSEWEEGVCKPFM